MFGIATAQTRISSYQCLLIRLTRILLYISLLYAEPTGSTLCISIITQRIDWIGLARQVAATGTV